MKPHLCVSALLLFGISTLSNALLRAQEATPPAAGQTNAAPLGEKAQARAKQLYLQECALCHGESGNGKTDVAVAMKLILGDWTDPKTLASKSDKELFDLIRNGKGPMAPEPVGRAKDDQVRELIQYIRSLASQSPAAAPAAPPAPAPAN
jgi:mono/diheme cytochrome c family protein